jgi:hypothetical protein
MLVVDHLCVTSLSARLMMWRRELLAQAGRESNATCQPSISLGSRLANSRLALLRAGLVHAHGGVAGFADQAAHEDAETVASIRVGYSVLSQLSQPTKNMTGLCRLQVFD